jgi:hypothetical protein
MSLDITKKTYKKLSFEVSEKSLSYCIFDTISNKIVHHERHEIETNDVLEEGLWKIFSKNAHLSQTFDSVVVLHNSHLNSIVPASLFDQNYLGSYMQYNNKVFETDYFAFDYLDTYELYNVFIPYTEINNYLLEHYDSFDFKNANSVFIKKALDFSKNKEQKQVWVHFQQDRFEIAVTKNQQLLLFNTFIYKTPEDFIYYLLFTYEQLQLNPEVVPVHFLGGITKENENFKFAYKYIRNCEIFDLSFASQALNVSQEDLRTFFNLFYS